VNTMPEGRRKPWLTSLTRATLPRVRLDGEEVLARFAKAGLTSTSWPRKLPDKEPGRLSKSWD